MLTNLDIAEIFDDVAPTIIFSCLRIKPASFRPHLLKRATLRISFNMTDDVECTLECEPGTKSQNDFRLIAQAGVNRISIGVQSFSTELLRTLNRRHTADTSRRMINDALRAGMANVHIDLMYGLPGQSYDDWINTIDEAVSLGVQHISTYRLIVFPDELLARKLIHNDLRPLPMGDEIEAMRQYARHTLASHEYNQYSLTEFAKTGFECLYVKRTWDGSDYLGFGPAAYSRRGLDLWENTLYHHEYHDRVSRGNLPVGRSIKMTSEERVARDVAMGLCILAVNVPQVRARSGVDLYQMFGREIDDLITKNLIQLSGDTLSLTAKGVRYATYVMKRFAA
jgi:oxygen-independent coproporphyrinogen III oxidase